MASYRQYKNGFNAHLWVQKDEFEAALNRATSVNNLCEILGKSKPSVYTYASRFGFELKKRWLGTRLRDDGYTSYRSPDNHRRIAERVLGRRLKPNECVHHIDGNKQNSKNSNLLICTLKYHQELHARMSLKYQQMMFGGC